LRDALAGRKALARTSNTPGRTQQINFFSLGERLMLVDLPGYGFAQAPKHLVAQWTALVESYLKGRTVLRRTCLLIDSRHGLKPNDHEMMARLDKAAVSYQIVLTKADKLKADELDKVVGRTAAAIVRRPAAYPEVLATSAAKGTGMPELRAGVAAACGLAAE